MSGALTPTHLSPIIPDGAKRDAFLIGAQAMQLIGARKVLQPQQLLQADVLNQGEKFTGILQPRRSTKTSGILAWMMGRGLTEPDLSMAFTICTTGKATRAKFIKELVPPLERVWPFEDDRPFRILRGAGSETIKFRNGSFLNFVAPVGDSFRSDAFDVIVLDEAQEPEPEDAEDLLTALLPTLDTRPDAQVVIAGTAGAFQEGCLLWSELVAGRAGLPRHAILDYHVDMALEDIDVIVPNWELTEPLVRGHHPGVHSGLTPMDAILDNWRNMKPDRFAREYLGVFGRASVTSLIRPEEWEAGLDAGALPSPPAHFRFALSVGHEGNSWAIVAAWRDDTRRVHLVVLKSGPATMGAYEECKRLAARYRVPVIYDSGRNANTAVTDRFSKARPSVRSESLTWAQVSTAAQLLLSEIRNRNVTHYGHAGMDEAVRRVVKRGTREAKRWAFGTPNDETDITYLEAAAAALKAYDDAPVIRAGVAGIVG